MLKSRLTGDGRKKKMKMNQFMNEKKWSILFGVAFLFIFAIVAGVFTYGMNNKVDSLINQMDRLASAVSSLEVSPSKNIIDEMVQKIDGISQKPDTGTESRLPGSEPEPKLEDLIKYISDLNRKVESIISIIEAGNQPMKLTADTVSDPTVGMITETLAEAITEKAPDVKTAEEVIAETEAITEAAADTEISPNTLETQLPDYSSEKKEPTNLIKAGEEFAITVKANEVINLYGYQFNLNYDTKKAAYKGSLKSSVDAIGTIFKKDMSDHLLVGATMIGDTPGFSGQNVTICTMVFTAIEDLEPADFTISGVNTVDADQNYIENIDGWSIELETEAL